MDQRLTAGRQVAHVRESAVAGVLAPETEVAVRWGYGALGSETVAVECGDRRVLRRAVEVLSERFQRASVDFAKGFAVFMAPSRRQGWTSGASDDLVRSLAECRSIPVARFGDSRWESESGEQRSEPDESYYTGEVALAYLRLRTRYRAGEVSLDDVEAFEEAHPATLAVEVEHTHYAARKRDLCRKIGITELWELGTEQARHAPAIVALQGPGGPRELEASAVIPGVRPENFQRALALLEEAGGLAGIVRGMERNDGRPERLMRAAGMEV